tara:strand:- start:2838 stop:3089 length:252 start_codon:yes stop_codon:yes gene_type:complete
MASLKSQTQFIAPSFRKVGATTFKGDVTVGVDATGHDVQFFGDTTGKSFLYDQSADELIVDGKVRILKGSAFQTGLASSLALD